MVYIIVSPIDPFAWKCHSEVIACLTLGDGIHRRLSCPVRLNKIISLHISMLLYPYLWFLAHVWAITRATCPSSSSSSSVVVVLNSGTFLTGWTDWLETWWVGTLAKTGRTFFSILSLYMANRGRHPKTHFGHLKANSDCELGSPNFFVGTSKEATSHIVRVFDLTYFQGHRGQSSKFHRQVAHSLAIWPGEL